MKILLDECVTKQLKKYLTDFEVYTLPEMGWSGKKNGDLIQLCIQNQFDILLTIDKNLVHQQNLKKYEIIVVVFDSKTSKIEDLIPLLPGFKSKLNTFVKFEAYIIT